MEQGSESMNRNLDATNGLNSAVVSKSLSAQQRRLWVLDQLEHAAASHHIGVCWRIRGKLDAARLEDATRFVQNKHHIVNSCFVVENDEPRAVRSGACGSLAMVDLTALPQGERESSALDQIAKDLHQRFELQTGPL